MTAKKPGPTPAQLIAARTNGAKSKGPVTAQGKSRLCQNRMVHGFRSNSITLVNEDRDAYDRHLDAYLSRYTPIDKTEEDLVGLLASNMWQIMRNNSIEISLFELEMAAVQHKINGHYEGLDQYGLLALAFKKSAGDNALELLRRYKSTAERAYHRAFQALEQIQKDRQPKQTAPAPSEILPAVQTQQVADPIEIPPIDPPPPLTNEHRQPPELTAPQPRPMGLEPARPQLVPPPNRTPHPATGPAPTKASKCTPQS